MRIAITGSRGHLGSVLADAFSMIGEVIPILADVRTATTLWKELSLARPDVVVHCAAIVGTAACDRAGIGPVFRVNTQGAGEVAKATCAIGARLVHLSSCSIYDPDGGRPYTEADEGDRAHTSYGQSKWESEEVVRDTMPASRLLILRPSFVYGASSGGDVSLLSQMARASRSLSAMVLDMDQSKLKSYLHHFDFSTAVRGLVEAGSTGTFNIASSDYRPWAQFAKILEERDLWPRYVIERPELDYKGDHVISTAALMTELPWWREATKIEEGVTEL